MEDPYIVKACSEACIFIPSTYLCWPKYNKDFLKRDYKETKNQGFFLHHILDLGLYGIFKGC
jgi:hypothetical protein